MYGSTGSTKPAALAVTCSYRPSGARQDRTFQGSSLVPLEYTISGKSWG